MAVKLFHIFISLMILVQSTSVQIDGFDKIKKMVGHYSLHYEYYGDNFTIYISKHYGELKESHKQEHKENEDNCIHNECTSQLLANFTLGVSVINVLYSKFPIKETLKYYNKELIPTFEKQKIFQPPQIV